MKLSIALILSNLMAITAFRSVSIKMLETSNKLFRNNVNEYSIDIHKTLTNKIIENFNLPEKDKHIFCNDKNIITGTGTSYDVNKLKIFDKITNLEVSKYNVYNINIVTNINTKLPHFQFSIHSFGTKIITTCDLIPKLDLPLNPKYLQDYYQELFYIREEYNKNFNSINFKNLYTYTTLSPVALTYNLETNDEIELYKSLIIKYVDIYYKLYCNEKKNMHIGYIKMEQRDKLLRKYLFENAPGIGMIKKVFINDFEKLKEFSIL